VLGGSEVTASCVVLACGAERIGALLQGGGRLERKLAEEAALPVARKVTLAHYVVRAEGLPVALAEAARRRGAAVGRPGVSASPPRHRPIPASASKARSSPRGRLPTRRLRFPAAKP